MRRRRGGDFRVISSGGRSVAEKLRWPFPVGWRLKEQLVGEVGVLETISFILSFLFLSDFLSAIRDNTVVVVVFVVLSFSNAHFIFSGGVEDRQRHLYL